MTLSKMTIKILTKQTNDKYVSKYKWYILFLKAKYAIFYYLQNAFTINLTLICKLKKIG